MSLKAAPYFGWVRGVRPEGVGLLEAASGATECCASCNVTFQSVNPSSALLYVAITGTSVLDHTRCSAARLADEPGQTTLRGHSSGCSKTSGLQPGPYI